MDHLRDTLVTEITGLKSLLRLSSDGIGDGDDLVAHLTRTKIALENFSTNLSTPPRHCGDDDDAVVRALTPDTLLTSSTSSSPSRFSVQSASSRSSLSSSSHCGGAIGGGDEAEEAEMEGCDDDAFVRLSALLAGLQAQAEAAVSSRFVVSAPSTPLPSEDGEKGGCTLQRAASLPYPILAPAPRRRRGGVAAVAKGEEGPGEVDGRDDDGMLAPSVLKGREKTWPSLPASVSPREMHPSTPLFERRNSGTPSKEMEIEGLLSEFLESRDRVEVMFRWVWMYLLGGGVVWWAVGWALGWGCGQCDCNIVR